MYRGYTVSRGFRRVFSVLIQNQFVFSLLSVLYWVNGQSCPYWAFYNLLLCKFGLCRGCSRCVGRVFRWFWL